VTVPGLALALALAAPVARASGDPPADPVYGAVELTGRVVLDAFSTPTGMPAVTFDHWNHRALYTCRVCHVDVGFAMKAGDTQVSAATNEAGQHCGACHDGKPHGGQVIFRACWGWPKADPARGCTRCHTGPNPVPRPGYDELKRTMPVDVAGDVDWAAALRRGLVKPVDVVEGITAKRAPMRIDRDVEIRPLGSWMAGVTFSHKKHVAWIACELCHPEIFPVGRRGTVKYDMGLMRAGRHCGACHGSVAFPLATCRRCHAGEDGRAVR
jgi:c(7)-type cytochrome triheme protein